MKIESNSNQIKLIKRFVPLLILICFINVGCVKMPSHTMLNSIYTDCVNKANTIEELDFCGKKKNRLLNSGIK